MTTWLFLAGLFLFTMLSFLTAAWISKRATEDRIEDPDAPKSALAVDGPGPNPATAPRGEDFSATGPSITPQGERV
jgi:hypothetical protein